MVSGESKHERTIKMFRVTIDEIDNQYGNKVIDRELILSSDGFWYEFTLSCKNSNNLGLGTCQCSSHSEYNSRKISKKTASEIIVEAGKTDSLDLETLRSLNNNSIEERIIESFCLLGFSSIGDVEEWCKKCYMMEVNPLPSIRKRLKDLCKVVFVYDNLGLNYDFKEPALVCKVNTYSEGSSVGVSLDVHLDICA